MNAKDGVHFQEHGEVKMLTPEEGEAEARKAEEYRQKMRNVEMVDKTDVAAEVAKEEERKDA